MRFDVLTLFPGLFQGFVTESLMAKAVQRNLIDIRLHDFRLWSQDKHHKVDDRPFGGGPGMVLMADPVVRCVEAIQQEAPPGELILLTPQGERFNQRIAESLVRSPRLVLLCGRYEGFDQRVLDSLRPRELSLGDFVLNGGEVAAMAIIEATARLIPGVLGDERSAVDDSFSSGNRGLEFPHYTRPRDYRGLTVPEILFSGDHGRIQSWREEQARQRTKQRRADLWSTGRDEPSSNPTSAESDGTADGE
ncbi:MAG: tRNA (guanosine(37)-N1)-methyltransferase TrmD [Pirellulaceae bacterium]